MTNNKKNSNQWSKLTLVLAILVLLSSNLVFLIQTTKALPPDPTPAPAQTAIEYAKSILELVTGKITGKELTEPGKLEHQPTPFSRSIFSSIHGVSEKDKDKNLKLRDEIYSHTGEPITNESKIRLGVKGQLGKHEHSYGQLLDEYNKGNRWVHVEFNEPTMTTK